MNINKEHSTHIPQLAAQGKITSHTYGEKEDQHVDHRLVIRTLRRIELFQKNFRIAIIAVTFRAGEKRSVVSVNGHYGSFESVPHKTEIRHPRHVRRDGIQVDQETSKEHERNTSC